MDTTFVRDLAMWVMDEGGSVGVIVDAIVREDTLI